MRKNKNETSIRTNKLNSKVWVISLKSDSGLNYLSTSTLKKISQVLGEAEQNSNVRCIVLTSNEKLFSAGADLNKEKAKDLYEVLDDERTQYWKKIRSFRKILITAVHRMAVGSGLELVLASDISLASSNTYFASIEVNKGLMPGAGASVLLPQRIGFSRAMKFLLTGDYFNSEQALEMGLISEIVAPEKILSRAIELANIISSKKPKTVEMIKKVVRFQNDSLNNSTLEYERALYSTFFQKS